MPSHAFRRFKAARNARIVRACNGTNPLRFEGCARWLVHFRRNERFWFPDDEC
jgi:hypothetical protein